MLWSTLSNALLKSTNKANQGVIDFVAYYYLAWERAKEMNDWYFWYVYGKREKFWGIFKSYNSCLTYRQTFSPLQGTTVELLSDETWR